MIYKPTRADRELAASIVAGMVFDTAAPDGTPIETGCVVTVAPADYADGYHGIEFLAADSEQVECEFSARMVVNLRAGQE